MLTKFSQISNLGAVQRNANLVDLENPEKCAYTPPLGEKNSWLILSPKKIFCKSCDSGKLPRVGEVGEFGQVPKAVSVGERFGQVGLVKCPKRFR